MHVVDPCPGRPKLRPTVRPSLFHFLWPLFLAVSSLAYTEVMPGGIPEDAFALRPLEWIPSFRQFRLVPVQFPELQPMLEVTALATTGDRVWIASRPWADTNLPPSTGRLWTFRPADNRMEPVRGALEVHSVSGLLTRGKQLWLTLDGGVASLDSETYTVDPFGAAQGLTSPRPVGVADTRRGLFALGDSGTLFRLSADQKAFLRHEGAAPIADPRDPSPWRHFAGSGDWVLAATESSVAFRHADAPQWNAIRDALHPSAPELQPATVSSVAGDNDGRFWIGTDAGLWSIEADTGRVEARERVGHLQVPGGIGIVVAPGMRPTAAAIAAARERVASGIRERMKLRARHARASRETGKRIDPITPRSRIPGEVRALAADRGFLWVATADPVFPTRSRILLFHPGSRKWVGWFPVGFPVRSLAADDRYLWIGVDSRTARATPLYAVEKSPLLSVPSARWTPDELDPADIVSKVAALPPKERAVYSFFSGDYATVLALTEPTGATEESLFLRALSQDPLGLDNAENMKSTLRLLLERFPDGTFALLASQILGSPPAGKPPAVEPAATAPATGAEEVMQRRDLNGDGKLNVVELRLWLGPATELTPWDADHDNAVNVSELARLMSENPASLTNSLRR